MMCQSFWQLHIYELILNKVCVGDNNIKTLIACNISASQCFQWIIRHFVSNHTGIKMATHQDLTKMQEHAGNLS